MSSNPKLDCIQFDLLSQEANRLLQHRRTSSKKRVNGQMLQDQVINIKNATASVVNGRLSTSQQ